MTPLVREMDHVLGHASVYWIARILLILLMVAYAGFMVLVFGRLFRPRNVMAMLRADLPAWPGPNYRDARRPAVEGHEGTGAAAGPRMFLRQRRVKLVVYVLWIDPLPIPITRPGSGGASEDPARENDGGRPGSPDRPPPFGRTRALTH